MPDSKTFYTIVTVVAMLLLFAKSRQVAKQGQSTTPEVVQILMWGVSLILTFYMPERIGGIPFVVIALLAITIVGARFNYKRLQEERAKAEARRVARMQGSDVSADSDDSEDDSADG